MTRIFADRVLETSTSTGTGDITVSGAPAGYQAFSAVCSTGDTFDYAIIAVDGSGVPTGQWETGRGTYSAANTITRTTLHDSSTGSAVSFGAGTKQVILTETATSLEAVTNASGAGGGRVSAQVWRVISTFENAGIAEAYVGVGELQYLDVSDANLCGSGSALASSSFNGTFIPSEAFDGSTSGDNCWLSGNSGGEKTNAWLLYDFGADVTPYKVSMAPPSYLGAAMVAFGLQYLDPNGVDWHTLAKFTPATWVVNTFQTFDIPESA